MTTPLEKEPPKSTIKRDTLVEIEKRVQAHWEKERVFEVDAPAPDSPDAQQPKYLVSFPYPYMNGKLHLGHSFSLSKCEFAAAFERLNGKRVLFPFGFHCTGMPIKACADKLKREIETFGCPPKFPAAPEDDSNEAVAGEEKEDQPSSTGPQKAMKKKAKVQAKSSGKKFQWQIMQSMGIPDDEIPKFADAQHWLYYFPPLAMADLKRFGAHVDWRRSFITTDVNPYYDSFVRWQFRKLKVLDKVKFGKRYTIFSPLDNQPCMDHDRQTGEGVAPQEYTLIKLEVVPESAPAKLKFAGKRVFMTAATLRPETMYGQTNCYVGPNLDYGAFEINDKEVFVCTERAARNLAYQGFAKQEGKVVKLADFKGSELVGLAVKAPLAKYDKVYVLPMDSVLPTKGTGVVTSVPSDSPDDFANLTDLKKKTDFYKIKEEWVKPFDPIPIIETASLGNMAAVRVCEEMKINSPKDRRQLDEAKEKVYKEGFYSGKMIVGKYAGKSVQEAKPLIRQEMIDAGQGCVYWEPENLVMSRSGDECVVCLTDQWYLNYGEEEWRKEAKKCLDKMEVFHDETLHNFNHTLGWLHEWACSRSYGLGSRLPWDEKWLIESLSDSTIYMAYYTIAHLLQAGSLDGSKPGLAGIQASQMTDDVWDYVLTDGPKPKSSTIPENTLELLKREFSYFYPLDLRVSGKDLVSNHLTFFIYNHTAIFPEKNWPKAVRANGHLLINGEKMSKSTGNFLTLEESINLFSSDGTRFALAEAGDGVEDANFDMEVANATILKLFTWKEWAEAILKEMETQPFVTGKLTRFNDLAFENDMNHLIKLTYECYTKMTYYDAVKFGYHGMVNARDRYLNFCTTVNEKPHVDLIKRFMEVHAIIMSPIIPHFSEFVWRDLLKKQGSVLHARWPKAGPVDETLGASKEYFERTTRDIRLSLQAELKPKVKKGQAPPPVIPPNAAKVFVTKKFPDWELAVIEVLKEIVGKNPKVEFKSIIGMISKDARLKPHMKQKRMMGFIKEMYDLYIKSGVTGLERKLPFSEEKILSENLEFMRLSLGLASMSIQSADAAGIPPEDPASKRAAAATPGSPSVYFFTK